MSLSSDMFFPVNSAADSRGLYAESQSDSVYVSGAGFTDNASPSKPTVFSFQDRGRSCAFVAKIDSDEITR